MAPIALWSSRLPRSAIGASVVLVTALLIGVCTAPGAVAGQAPNPDPNPVPGPGGSLTPGGGKATAVDVTVSGSGLRGRAGVRHATIPAVCWWQDALGPADDPKAMQKAYESGALQTLTWNTYGGASWALWLSKRSYVAATPEEFAAAAAKPAGSVSWYMAVCRDGAQPSDYWGLLGYCPTGVRYRAFPTGHAPPARVSPIDLAIYANQQLVLPEPAVDRNPKVTAVGGATLVGLATWFWVTDPAAAGGPDGSLWVRAQADDVYAVVTATNQGLSINSPAGSTSCTPGQARTPYTPGTPESSACTLVFTKASVAHPAGWPVTVRATWNLAWTGSGGTGADLGPQPHTWNATIPVAEVQTIVTGN